jgi:N-formylglutamate amidohydrolase
MVDPRMEDHAVGVELQLTELVEEQERAEVQGRHEDATRLGVEIAELHAELARTAARIVGEV